MSQTLQHVSSALEKSAARRDLRKNCPNTSDQPQGPVLVHRHLPEPDLTRASQPHPKHRGPRIAVEHGQHGLPNLSSTSKTYANFT